MSETHDDAWRTVAELEAVFCRDPDGLLPGDFRSQLGEAIAGNRIRFRLGDGREWFFHDWALSVAAIEQNEYETTMRARRAKEIEIPRYNPFRRDEGVSSSSRTLPLKPQPPSWDRLLEDPKLQLQEGQIRRLFRSVAAEEAQSGLSGRELPDQLREPGVKSKGGRPSTPRIEEALEDLLDVWKEHGRPQTKADAKIWLQDWYIKMGLPEPAESTLSPHVNDTWVKYEAWAARNETIGSDGLKERLKKV